jgi:hypothetical protein
LREEPPSAGGSLFVWTNAMQVLCVSDLVDERIYSLSQEAGQEVSAEEASSDFSERFAEVSLWERWLHWLSGGPGEGDGDARKSPPDAPLPGREDAARSG